MPAAAFAGGLRAMDARLRDCALSCAVDAAVAYRAPVISSRVSPPALAAHVTAAMRTALDDHRWLCERAEPAYLAPCYRWGLVLDSLKTRHRKHHAPGRDPRSAEWEATYSQPIPGDTLADGTDENRADDTSPVTDHTGRESRRGLSTHAADGRDHSAVKHQLAESDRVPAGGSPADSHPHGPRTTDGEGTPRDQGLDRQGSRQGNETDRDGLPNPQGRGGEERDRDPGGSETNTRRQDTQPHSREAFPTDADRERLKALYHEWRKDAGAGWDGGTNVVGETPNQSPGERVEGRDPPTGEQLLTMEGDKASRSEKLRRNLFEFADNVSDVTDKGIQTVQDIMSKPSPTGHADVHVPAGPYVTPATTYSFINDSNAADATIALGVALFAVAFKVNEIVKRKREE